MEFLYRIGPNLLVNDIFEHLAVYALSLSMQRRFHFVTKQISAIYMPKSNRFQQLCKPRRGIIVVIEYQSVCTFVGIGSPTRPTASECVSPLEPKGEGRRATLSQSIQAFFPVVQIGSHTPSPASECVTTLGPKGGEQRCKLGRLERKPGTPYTLRCKPTPNRFM